MDSSDIFLAVECGATNTVSAIFNSKGNVLGMGFSGPGSHHAVKIDVVKANLLESVKNAFDSAGVSERILKAGCFGMAALDTKQDFEIVSKLLSELNVVEKPIIVGDHVTAFYTVTFGRPGIVVISGTGSIAYGMNERGEVARAGGWEWLVSDGGSAYFIAREGLSMAVKAYDNIGEKTVLLKLFMEGLGAKDFDDFIQKIYENTEKTRIASLAPIVVKAYRMNDRIARDILRRAGEELSLLAVSVAKKLKMEDSKVIIGCVGGVFKSELIVWKYFRRCVKSFLPYASVKKPNPTTIEGAIFLCLKENGLKLTRNVVRNVKDCVKKFYSLH
ncbi:MAG: BadF/BadG/BcrA/BcrD ATPase family protein [Nitrososphaeria archaeon]